VRICAVPLFGIEGRGCATNQVHTKPTFIMLPFNIISELSPHAGSGVRLFGNMMTPMAMHWHPTHNTPFIFPIT